MKYLAALSLLLLMAYMPVQAQREYSICDSTTYTFKPGESSLVMGRSILYEESAGVLTQLYQFPMPDGDHFVRDFDVVSPDLLYAVVGDRYIGDTTTLFRSTDEGQTWQVDTSFYPATRVASNFENYNSINALHAISADTLILFVGYYNSGLFYSTDGGQTWKEWFVNLISHYHGIFSCGDKYYLWAQEGDGFQASMVSFPKEELFSPSYQHPQCFNEDTACIYATPNVSRCQQYIDFRQFSDTVCPKVTTGIITINSTTDLQLFPQPAHNKLHLKWTTASGGEVRLNIYSLAGQLLLQETTNAVAGSNEYQLSLPELPQGSYLLQLVGDKTNSTRLFTKQ